MALPTRSAGAGVNEKNVSVAESLIMTTRIVGLLSNGDLMSVGLFHGSSYFAQVSRWNLESGTNSELRSG